MSFRWILPVLLAPLLVVAPACAQDLAEQQAKADKGDAQAQFEIGQRYAAGDGVAKDEAAALTWFQKAAKQGHTKAEVSLGSIYAHGFGVPQDWAESIRWYRLAASKGDRTALHNLGLDYVHGHGVERDPAEGARWFRKAAVQGHARATYNLGELYEEGKGVPQDVAMAFVLYSLAGAHENQEHIFGKEKAAEVIVKRTRTEQQLTPEQRAAAAKQIAAWQALAEVHPRKFGAPGLIGKSRGWWVWRKWNPETWEAEIGSHPPKDVFQVRVLPWATTYRHQAYGARFDEILPGEKVNVFFDADENHRRGYVVHFQDEISQMKGHGHFWQVQAAADATHFTAQVYAGDKPLEEKTYAFEVDPACVKWLGGKQVDEFPLKAGDKLYMTWVYVADKPVAKLLADDASLDVLKQRETARITAEVAAEGMAGQLDTVAPDVVQFMVYSSYWAQSGQLKPGQPVAIASTGKGYRPTDLRIPGQVISQKNRGMYGSGVNDVMLKLDNPADAEQLLKLEGHVLRLIPGQLD